MSWEKSCAGIRSASDVEPRTSANRSESSISAPPGFLSTARKHARQSRRLSFEGPKPNGLRMTLPGALGGAAQSLQRGPAGIFPRTARMYLSWPRSPVRTARHASSLSWSWSWSCSWSWSWVTGSVTTPLCWSAMERRKLLGLVGHVAPHGRIEAGERLPRDPSVLVPPGPGDGAVDEERPHRLRHL